MRVVEVDRDAIGQQVEVFGLRQEARQDILNGRGNEEVLLSQAQFAPFGRAVIRIEHAAHRARPDAWGQGIDKRSAVESQQIDAADGLRAP